MANKDFVAPRADGTLARYRAYLDMNPVLIVDADRAFGIANELGKYNPSYRWSTALYTWIAFGLMVGGFVALFWLPWWTPIVGLVVGMAVFRSNKKSCADFVREIIQQHPGERARFAAAGIVRDEIPENAPTL